MATDQKRRASSRQLSSGLERETAASLVREVNRLGGICYFNLDGSLTVLRCRNISLDLRVRLLGLKTEIVEYLADQIRAVD